MESTEAIRQLLSEIAGLLAGQVPFLKRVGRSNVSCGSHDSIHWAFDVQPDKHQEEGYYAFYLNYGAIPENLIGRNFLDMKIKKGRRSHSDSSICGRISPKRKCVGADWRFRLVDFEQELCVLRNQFHNDWTNLQRDFGTIEQHRAWVRSRQVSPYRDELLQLMSDL